MASHAPPFLRFTTRLYHNKYIVQHFCCDNSASTILPAKKNVGKSVWRRISGQFAPVYAPEGPCRLQPGGFGDLDLLESFRGRFTIGRTGLKVRDIGDLSAVFFAGKDVDVVIPLSH